MDSSLQLHLMSNTYDRSFRQMFCTISSVFCCCSSFDCTGCASTWSSVPVKKKCQVISHKALRCVHEIKSARIFMYVWVTAHSCRREACRKLPKCTGLPEILFLSIVKTDNLLLRLSTRTAKAARGTGKGNGFRNRRELDGRDGDECSREYSSSRTRSVSVGKCGWPMDEGKKWDVAYPSGDGFWSCCCPPRGILIAAVLAAVKDDGGCDDDFEEEHCWRERFNQVVKNMWWN